ncbi:MAG: hypothetical protein VYC29_10030, partial [Pseudomonadota bacterium]|nr:hypothetical protein [Pseudomonadota bacterium]
KFKPNSRLIARNVEVIHYGNDEANAYWGSTTWASPHGIAIGTCSGSIYRFENVKATGPRAGLSAHDQIDFTSPSRVEIFNSDLTATWATYWALRLESIGAPMMNQCVMQGTKLSGEISMAVTPWLPTALDQQPADHRTWDLTGSGNSPAVFRIEDFGRALRITSATTGTASKVVISGTATPILFGKTGTEGITRIDGDVGMAGYAYGWADIADAGSKAAITKLGARLGNRTGSPLTLTVQVDALAPVNITLDQNYTAMTNAAILAVINTALGSTATASEFAVGQRYRPSITDEEQSLQNTSGTTILMGMALAIDSNGARTVRPMLSTDLPTAFAGVAWEDIRPGAYGRVKTGGWLPTTDLLRSDGGSPNPGTTFTIDPAKPGYVLSNNASGSGILPVIRGSLGAGLWTVAVRTQIDGQVIVDQAAELVQEAYDTIGALGDSDNIEAIGRIPSEGAQVIPRPISTEPEAGSLGAYLNLRTMFKTKAIAESTLIASSVDLIEAMNFDTNEVEGSRALYRRVNSEPVHAGKIQTAGGQWWEIAETVLRPEMFGAFGFDDEDKIVEDTYGLQNSLDVSAALLRAVDGKVATYIIDSYKGARPSWTNGGRWTHGGIIFPAGAKFVGAGRGRTIFKNGSDLGRCLARWRNSGLHHIEGCTFDYDFPNKDSVPYSSPATSTTGQGGTGILFEGGGTAVMDIVIRDVEVKNTAGYGVGIENVTVSSALIDGLYVDKPGADAIDIKSWPLAANGGPKVGIMTNVFILNGCGHNFIATGEEGGHDDQACIDIGGSWHVSNVHIDNLTSDPASTGNTGIRFRSATLADGREGAPRSTLTGFTIRSTKAEGVGSDTDNDIIGLGIYSPDVSVSNGYIENCRRNLLIGSYGAAENPDPMDVSLTNITCVNANDATGTGANMQVSSAVRDITALGIKIRGGDIGANMDGSGGALDLNIEDCALGVKATKNVWRNYNWVGLRLAGNTVDSDTMPDIVGNATIANGSLGVVADRRASIKQYALADDSLWSGEDAWFCMRQMFAYDASGTQGEIFRDGVLATGASGAGKRYRLSIEGVNMLQISAGALGFFGDAPVAKPTVTGSRGGNAAVTSLLTQLASLGLITNGTST